ncbi:MAG: thiamine phosphate synthase [Candidatus Diapherotrites archaeon]
MGWNLYFITDSNYSKNGAVKDAVLAADCGAGVIQYREKNKEKKEQIKDAKKIMKKINGRNIFIINDFVEVAKESNADGVHLGQEDGSIEKARKMLGKNKIIGVTVHNLMEAIEAEKHGASYLGISPIFSTPTKADAGKPCGVELIKEIKKHSSIPLIGIGGITEENCIKVIQSGADGVAVISDIYKAKDFCGKIRKLNEVISNAKAKKEINKK